MSVTHSISSFVLENHDRSHNTAKKLRKVIADVVKAQPDEYSEVVLGRTPTAYSEWIQKPESWGGAIELAIFAKHYRTEIAAFDITTARHQIFGQDGNFTQRVLVVRFALALETVVSNLRDRCMTAFTTILLRCRSDGIYLRTWIKLCALLERSVRLTLTLPDLPAHRYCFDCQGNSNV